MLSGRAGLDAGRSGRGRQGDSTSELPDATAMKATPRTDASRAQPMTGPRHDKKRESVLPSALRLLPIEPGDRLTDETGEYEVIGRPYTTNAGKDVHVRVKRVDNAEITMIRSWSAHERVAVKREQ